MKEPYYHLGDRIRALLAMAYRMRDAGPNSIQQYVTGKIEAYENCLRIVAELEKEKIQ